MKGLENFQVGEPKHSHVPLSWAPNSMGTETPLFEISPFVSLYLAIHLYPLIDFVVNQYSGK